MPDWDVDYHGRAFTITAPAMPTLAAIERYVSAFDAGQSRMPSGATAGMLPPSTPSSTARDAVLPPALRGGGRSTEISVLGRPGIIDQMAFMQSVPFLNQIQEGEADAYKEGYFRPGPGRVLEGVQDIARGDIAKGGRKVVAGGLTTAAPVALALAPEALMAAPLATLSGTAAGAVAAPVAQSAVTAGGRALGLTEDQAGLAGDVAGLAAGAGAAILAGKYVPQAVQAWQASRATDRGVQAVRALTTAVPPSRSAPYDETDLDRAVPWLQAAKANMPDASLSSGQQALDDAIGLAEQHVNAAIQRVPNHPIGRDAVAAVRAQLSGSPQANFVERGLRSVLNSYPQLGRRSELTLVEADSIRQDLNAINRALLKKNNYQAADAMRASPQYAAREAVVDALRDGEYTTLDELGMPGFRELRQEIGSLIRVRNAFEAHRFNAEKMVAGSAKAGPIRKATAAALQWSPLPAKVTNPLAAALKARKLTRDDLFAQAMGLLDGGETPGLPAILERQPVAGLLPAPAVQLGAPVQPSPGPMTPVMPAAMMRVPPYRPELPAPRESGAPIPSHESTVRTNVPIVDRSGGTSVQAASTIQRDPRTGKFKRVYTSEPKKR